MMLQSYDDYEHIISRIKKEGNEVNDTYELSGEVIKVNLATTESIADILKIDDEFTKEFTKSIIKFIPKQLGPYDTSAYFTMIPSLKAALSLLEDDCIETRRCIVKFPESHCFQTIQFLFRENTVNVVCYMRSCNAIKNLRHDIWICSLLGNIFAKQLRDVFDKHPYECQRITMMFGSLHVFKEDL